jgi:hypothetical protein
VLWAGLWEPLCSRQREIHAGRNARGRRIVHIRPDEARETVVNDGQTKERNEA